MTDALARDIANLEVTSLIGGNSATGEVAAFVRLTVTLTDGRTIASDLAPTVAASIGLDLLTAGEAAENDVALYRLATQTLGMPERAVGELLADLARHRTPHERDSHPAIPHEPTAEERGA